MGFVRRVMLTGTAGVHISQPKGFGGGHAVTKDLALNKVT
jgi:hypothetical protein